MVEMIAKFKPQVVERQICQTNPESKQGGYKEKLLKDTGSISRTGSSYQQTYRRKGRALGAKRGETLRATLGAEGGDTLGAALGAAPGTTLELGETLGATLGAAPGATLSAALEATLGAELGDTVRCRRTENLAGF
eukprot:jgi/Psemu1/37544/gm1.37544_g